MTGMGNPDTQREQAALRAAGHDLRLDGIRGEKTEAARKQFAIGQGIDPNDTAKVNAALDAKLADPKLRDNVMMFRLAGPNPNRDDVAMAQWMLKAGGRDMAKSIDPITGMMDGKRGTDTNEAIAENRRRQPTMAELKANMSENNFEWARKKVEGLLGQDFKTAMQTPAFPAESSTPGPTVAKAATDQPRVVAKVELPQP